MIRQVKYLLYPFHRYLLESGDHADCVLVFCPESGEPPPSDYGFQQRLELFCHRAILGARSTFFRNVLERRARDAPRKTPTRIVLDETVIPKRYARVLLRAVYVDALELNLMTRNTGTYCSLESFRCLLPV